MPRPVLPGGAFRKFYTISFGAARNPESGAVVQFVFAAPECGGRAGREKSREPDGLTLASLRTFSPYPLGRKARPWRFSFGRGAKRKSGPTPPGSFTRVLC